MILALRTSPIIKIFLILLMAFFLMGCEKDEIVFWEEEATKVMEDVAKREEGHHTPGDDKPDKPKYHNKDPHSFTPDEYTPGEDTLGGDKPDDDTGEHTIILKDSTKFDESPPAPLPECK